ncbi:MAG TPA: hypothetical protein PKA63_09770 [Oligoflexia bacterium]|nr:hypothetical protein [Oligoflexia bacterium]HMP48942.1 hypothetical protein [Oligoflexia bacterium]
MKIFLFVLTALSLITYYYFELTYIGFPDGHITSYDYLRKYILIAASIARGINHLFILLLLINLCALVANSTLGDFSGRGG